MKKYQGFLSANFQFFGTKFSIYLNRRVFVMREVSKFKSKRILFRNSGVNELTFGRLGKRYSKRHFEIFFLFFPKKGLDILNEFVVC